MNKFMQMTLPLFVAAIALLVSLANVQPVNSRPALGVTNFDSIHLSDTGGTATPNLLANQNGPGVIAEFRDGGTPVARIPNGGGLNVLVGDLTASGDWVLAQQSLVVTTSFIITPTKPYVVLTSVGTATSSATTPIITTTATTGQVLVLRNGNAADVLTVDGVGGTVECKANVALGASDTLTLIFNGLDWNCLSSYDNS